MKRLITLYILVFMSATFYSAFGQHCGPITAGYEFVHNNLQFNILNGGLKMNEVNCKVGIGPDGNLDTREYGSLMKSTQLWAGGVDPVGNLKLAASQLNNQDWVMGPLDENGETDPLICESWDRVFSVTKDEILEARKIFAEGGACENIPASVLGWPGKGNPHLSFEVKNEAAHFWDFDGDDLYDPCKGDFPMVEFRSIGNIWGYDLAMPSKLSFYMMNDNGKPSIINGALATQLQVGVHVFAFEMQDLKDVIYIKYDIINRNHDDIRDLFLGNWVDFDIGCSNDDYIGSDSIHNMVYAYNSRELECPSLINPLYDSQVGISYFKTNYIPYDIQIIDGETVLVPIQFGSGGGDTLVFSGMDSSLIPVDCDQNPEGVMCDFSHETMYYFYLKGRDKSNEPILDKDGNITKMMFSGDPANPDSWSLCNEDSQSENISISSMGPLLIQPWSKKEILQAIIHVKTGDDEGCSSIAALQHKQELVERLFNREFYHQVGPPPPKITPEKTDEGLLLSISNVPLDFSENVQIGEKFFPEKYYFEGIKIYQVKSENFDLTELYNEDLSRLLYQGDVQNGVGTIFNIDPIFTGDTKTYVPFTKVVGADTGIELEVLFDTDLFTDLPVESGTEYYFIAVSYAYNNYEPYNALTETGQQYPYLESTCGLKVINSQTALSSTEISPKHNYTFESFGQEWQINNIKSDLQIRLLSANGQLIDSRRVKRGGLYSSEMISNMASGLYFISVKDERTMAANSHKVYKIQ